MKSNVKPKFKDDMKLEVMKEALLKADLVTAKGKMTKEAKWQLRRIKNRFGDVALFELWDRNRWPRDWFEKCGFCGKRLGSTKVHVEPARRVKCYICWQCYLHGRTNHAFEEIK